MEIRLEHLSKRFGEQAAVDDVGFRAGIGVTGFLGPNGAGKSTTMRMITGYLEPSAGTVTIGGQAVWPSTPEVRRLVGYLPEHNPLYTDLYVREYLRYTAKIQGVTNVNARVDEVIEQVGLTREVRKQIGQLSKGYRQRVGLAQAIVHDPPVVILDEPTNGFDPNQLSEVRGLISKLGETKVVLLSTHIMQEVQSLCRRVLIINNGKLVADDPIERLQDRMSGQTMITVTVERVGDLKKLEQLKGVRDVHAKGSKIAINVTGKRELRPQIAELLAREGWGLLELKTDTSNIEDVFQRLTRQNQPA